MTTEELKAIQAPIKEGYRNQPERAMITLKATGQSVKESLVGLKLVVN